MPRSRLLPAVIVTLALAPSLGAQTTGSIRGKVTDDRGAALPGAALTLRSDDLLGSRTVRAGSNGTYLLNLLPPGVYRIEATLDNYQNQVVEGARVRINSTTVIDFTLLQIFSEEVLVTSDATLVDLMSSSSPTSFSADFIEDLPTYRSFWDMMALAPGISPNVHGDQQQSAFGSGVQSSTWQIDGLSLDSPKLGGPWQYLNPDTIEEVQVLGIGAPAEFGNMLGAAFNVVTKTGGNDFSGTLNLYWQDEAINDDPEVEDVHDYTLTLGGPFKKDKAWFFLSGQYFRQTFDATESSDRFDLKVSSRFNDRTTLDLKLHGEDWTFPQKPVPTYTPSALYAEEGTNPAWGLHFTSVLSENTFLEAKYAGWWGDDLLRSQTGSKEPAYVDFDTFSFSGGLAYPRDFENSTDQLDVSASHFAEQFMGGGHDFKFGVQLSQGDSVVETAPSYTGSYYYQFTYAGTVYDYEYFRNPYIYGSDHESVAAFADDSWQVNDRLTLNLGLRYDQHEGVIPSFDRIDSQRNPTGEKLPSVDALDWKDLSPRLGFAFAGKNGRSVVRGAFGIYHDGPIGANWDYPPPGLPPSELWYRNPATGAYDILVSRDVTPFVPPDPDLRSPHALQVSLGYERQLGTDVSLGAQVVYKEEEDFVGWEVLDDGVYEEVAFTDPFTGTVYTLLNAVVPPTVRKGNDPGFTVLGDVDYYSDYEAFILTFDKRYSHRWRLMSSYTYSEAKGRTPKPFSAFHLSPLLGTRLGSDPNQVLNSDQLTQADRTHMFRLQASFELPWQLLATTTVNLQTGRPYNRQISVSRADDGTPLAQGSTVLILEPASDRLRYDSQSIVDLSLGKRFQVGRVTVKLDAQILNVLDDGAVERFASLVLADPSKDYVVRTRVDPRRYMLRFGLEF